MGHALARTLLSAAAIGCGIGSAQAQEKVVQVGQVMSIASAATFIASEKGYFKQQGIRVEISNLDSSTDSLAVVAQNRFQIVEGGISAAYFNAIAKDLPVTITVDRVSSPLNHKLLVRADLKDQIKDIKQLKGRSLASNSRGSITNYEIGKILG
jgi:NitT/TauT family transport system substrate-binding protein